MATLLEALQDHMFEPVGITHQGKPELPPIATRDNVEYEVYLVNHQLLPIPPDGRFPKVVQLDREALSRIFYKGMEERYAHRIHEVADHPEGWAGHEHRLRVNLSGLEATEFRAAASDFNQRRELAVLEHRVSRGGNALRILGYLSHAVARQQLPIDPI